MLFNSFYFILCFLPICLIIYSLTIKLKNKNIKIIWLVFCSLLFYGWWNPYYLILIIFSILFNFYISNFLISKNRLIFLWIGVSINLGILIYYKYLNFFIENVNELVGSNILMNKVILPLGISFFTFQQIAYLVDIYNKKSEKGSILYYFSFVTFFPQLIAGPIVNYRKIINQFHFTEYLNFNKSIMVGITIFVIGLFKKLCIADNIAIYSNHMFEVATYEPVLTFFESWATATAFTLQLYFDFSGYSDMAVGLGLLFGISLPLNFNSPFKSTNISIFWRNWHMTLSEFIRNYIFVPLSFFLSRFGLTYNLNSLNLFIISIFVPIFFSYLLIGVWHGAGWNFILFGLIHGFFLLTQIIWKNLLVYFSIYNKIKENRIYRFISQLLTFLCVVSAFVLFRAESIETAKNIYYSMIGFNKISLPVYFFSNLQSFLMEFNFIFDGLQKNSFISTPIITVHLIILIIIVMFFPNSIEIMRNYIDDKDHLSIINKKSIISWKPNFIWGIIIGIMFFLSLLNITAPSEFLYFDF